MELDQFLKNLQRLDGEIDKQAALLDGNKKKAFQELPQLFGQLSALLPDWFYFIEQTEIGTKMHILTILTDMEAAMRAEDGILLSDTMLYGLQTTVEKYIGIIDEAMGNE